MSDSLELFMEDICLLPGWILRNLSLMREIDKKSNDIRIKLEEKRSLYLKNLKQMINCNSTVNNKDEDFQLIEIDELQKEHRALLKEKIAISDQSIHFIRHDGEILRRHYEQLRETLTENFTGNDNNSILNNHSGRLSLPNNLYYKNSSVNHSNNMSTLSTNNSVKNREYGSLSNNFVNNNWSLKLQSDDFNNNNFLSPKSSFNNDSLNKSTKKRRSSTPAVTNDLLEQTSSAPRDPNLDMLKDGKMKKIDDSGEKKDVKLNTCSICEGSELINNKIISCESCSRYMHMNCCWMINPKLCQKCCKKDSIPPKSTYDIEYSVSQINTPKSDNIKSKSSRKK